MSLIFDAAFDDEETLLLVGITILPDCLSARLAIVTEVKESYFIPINDTVYHVKCCVLITIDNSLIAPDLKQDSLLFPIQNTFIEKVWVKRRYVDFDVVKEENQEDIDAL